MTTAGLGAIRLARRLGSARGLMLWNRWFRHATRGRRLASVATIAATFGFVFVFLWLPQLAALELLRRHGLTVGIATTLRGGVGLGLTSYLLVVLYGSVLFSVGSLLLSRDLELLLVSPRPTAEIIGAKTLLRVGGLFATVSILTAPLVVGLPVLAGQPLAGLLGLVVLLTLPMLPVAIVSTAVIGAIRFVPPDRGRAVIAGMAVLLAVGLNIANLVLNPTSGSTGRAGLKAFGTRAASSPLASTPWLPTGWGARAIADGLYGRWLPAIGWCFLVAGTGLLALVVSIQVSGRIYVSGWSENGARRGDTTGTEGPAHTGPVSLALNQLGVDRAAVAIFSKDWKTRRRDVVMLVRMMIPIAFLAFLSFRTARNLGVFGGLPPGPFPASLALVPIPILTLGLANSLGLTSMSLEGGAIWMYAVSPNRFSRILMGKLLVAVPPVALVALLSSIFTETLTRPGWSWAIPAVLLATVFGACLAAALVAVGGLFPRFNWTDSRKMVSPLGSWAGVVVQWGTVLAIATSLTVALALARFHVVPVRPAYLSGVGVAAGICVAVAAAALWAATARLRSIEYGMGIVEQSLD
ncbi:MAG TPA: hypothetical protein VGR61_05070 [Candidatus Dormibacteraeota bacterium]|nr:hypothetical protein [Candidatus Dormibacteraeota bacterium]